MVAPTCLNRGFLVAGIDRLTLGQFSIGDTGVEVKNRDGSLHEDSEVLRRDPASKAPRLDLIALEPSLNRTAGNP